MGADYLRIPVISDPYCWASFIPIGAWGPIKLPAGQAEP